MTLSLVKTQKIIKKATAVFNQVSPITSNYASFNNDIYTENIESNSDILNIEVTAVQAEWSRMQGMIQTLLLPILKKLKNRLKHVKNGSQFASLMCSVGNTAWNINRRKGQIKVQPTSISRRKTGVTKGSKRISAGRKLNGHSTNIKKRPHNLSFNVVNNQMNGKSHGNGH